ncbi:hypothetical protein BDV27DRAFT_139796 [Aspergillus caelatus]|uniref:Uncharacterized protein n=1 Tax=Aspergillus caelatus TaxID=61420 RepID=A0A5N6ZHQ8_9EURO|nr:uncharacterized protein BDV27DRAFT_139796 [Aspergillus caelatus]KAE8357194.1 hypothetical protein BDV27DRAFT_139796 [Aspergillus caelatus]
MHADDRSPGLVGMMFRSSIISLLRSLLLTMHSAPGIIKIIGIVRLITPVIHRRNKATTNY